MKKITTPVAAKALYCSLQNCVWKVHNSKKVIRIDQAAQQVCHACIADVCYLLLYAKNAVMNVI
jgi:hypothetical protein